MTRSVLGLLIAFPAATAVLAAGEEMRQGPYLVGDFDSSGIPIQKDEEDAIWIPAMAVDARSRGFFELDDGAHGLELWASDGTPEGTGLLKDIFPGPAGSNPELLTAAGGRRIGGQRDGYHLVYQEAGLELELKVRVETLDGLPGAAAGIALREGLEAEARQAAIVLEIGPGGGPSLLRALRRTAAGEEAEVVFEACQPMSSRRASCSTRRRRTRSTWKRPGGSGTPR